MRKRTKRLALVGLAVVGLAAVGTVCVSYGTRGESGPAETASTGRSAPAATPVAVPQQPPSLTFLTLNVAHGRAEGMHQALQRKATIEGHLDAIAVVLIRERADIVALQESDGPSIWSGGFDHVAYLAEHANYTDYCHGHHVQGLKLAYGTALLSRLPMDGCRSVTFAPSPPTFSKGFVVGTVPCPGRPERPERQIDVVSVHLDFSRESVREQQVRTVIAELSTHENPLVIMGDFNCEWTGEGEALETLAEELDLSPFRPEADDMPTFASSGKRLDWILLSPELEFVEYRTVPDAVSDHRAVVATVKWRD